MAQAAVRHPVPRPSRVVVSLAGLALLVAAPTAVPRHFDLTGAKADRVFFVLGMLMEHPGGRAVRGPDEVELFYCSEKALVPVFTRVVTALATEQGLPADVRSETKQGCLTTVLSPSVAAGLAAFYPRGARPIDVRWFVRPGAPAAAGGIPPADLERRRALAYVAGAWARHRRDGTLVLTAGSGKADRLAMLLTALGCRGVRVDAKLDAVPGSQTVYFEPSADVDAWLKRAW